MNGLVLKQLLQVMDIGSDKVTYDLVFSVEGKGDLGLPVPKETADVLINWLYAGGNQAPAVTEEEQLEEEPLIQSDLDEEEMGEDPDVEEWGSDGYEEENAFIFPALTGPMTEDEVPSL